MQPLQGHVHGYPTASNFYRGSDRIYIRDYSINNCTGSQTAVNQIEVGFYNGGDMNYSMEGCTAIVYDPNWNQVINDVVTGVGSWWQNATVSSSGTYNWYFLHDSSTVASGSISVCTSQTSFKNAYCGCTATDQCGATAYTSTYYNCGCTLSTSCNSNTNIRNLGCGCSARGCTGCVSEETLIMLADGSSKQAKYINSKDKLLTYNFDKKILEVTQLDYIFKSLYITEIYHVELENSIDLYITENHEFLTDSGWLSVREILSMKDYPKVFLDDGKELNLKRISRYVNNMPVYNFTVKKNTGNFIANGFILKDEDPDIEKEKIDTIRYYKAYNEMIEKL